VVRGCTIESGVPVPELATTVFTGVVSEVKKFGEFEGAFDDRDPWTCPASALFLFIPLLDSMK
jgi:hypothetical protein